MIFITGEGQFRQISSVNTCTCPNDTVLLIYECTVMGGFVTTWRGSAINQYCEDSGGQILLLHSRFGSGSNYFITCSNGTIMGQSVRIENNTYTSRLTITTVSSNILGDTVECAHSQNGMIHIIGNTTIELHTGMKQN